MQIEIHNYVSGSYLLESQPQRWDSIVILDSKLRESEFVYEQSLNALQLRFDDITTETPNKISPNADLIRRAIAFGIEAENLMVCCRAGQSRSAATALAIAYESKGEEFALSLLNPKRHSPNYRIVRIANQILKRPGLLNAYDEWGFSIGDTRLTDYLAEIEAEYDQLESLGARDRISICD